MPATSASKGIAMPLDQQKPGRGDGNTLSLDQLVHVTDTSSDLFARAMDLYVKTFTASYEQSRESVTAAVEEEKYSMLALTANGKVDEQVMGIAVIGHLKQFQRAYCLLDYFVVDPQHRGNGFGGKFFNLIVSYLRERTHYKVMTLECDKSLVGWYGKLGAKLSCVASSFNAENADSATARPENFEFMAVPVDPMYDGSDSVLTKTERLKKVLVEVRSRLHDMYCHEEREKIEDGVTKKYILWW